MELEMTKLETQAELIRAYEIGFARKLAVKVMGSPQLSLWMILIPIIFAFHYTQVKRLAQGRREFTEQYMIGIERAIATALEKIGNDRNPNYAELAALPEIPQTAYRAHEELLKITTEEFASLLSSSDTSATGESYEDLVKLTHKTRVEYESYLRNRNKAEKEYNLALRAHLGAEKDNTEDLENLIGRIETISEKIRDEDLTRFYSS